MELETLESRFRGEGVDIVAGPSSSAPESIPSDGHRLSDSVSDLKRACGCMAFGFSLKHLRVPPRHHAKAQLEPGLPTSRCRGPCKGTSSRVSSPRRVTPQAARPRLPPAALCVCASRHGNSGTGSASPEVGLPGSRAPPWPLRTRGTTGHDDTKRGVASWTWIVCCI